MNSLIEFLQNKVCFQIKISSANGAYNIASFLFGNIIIFIFILLETAMKQFTITYVVHPHFNIPFKYQIAAKNEIESIQSAKKALNLRHPEGVSIVTCNQR